MLRTIIPPANVRHRIMRLTPTGCWEWLGAVRTNGYGVIGWHRDGIPATLQAHRVSFVAWRGPIPEGAHLHHVCGMRRCVNPMHVEPMAQGAHNALHVRTYCKRGHLLAETARSNGAGARTCRVCSNASRRARLAA